MAEFDIGAIVEELKITYRTTNLVVRVTSDRNEYRQFLLSTAKPELLEGRNLKADDMTGMFFMPSVNSVDDQHHIGIHLPSFESSLYRDELTHEFSNYEAWRKWGNQLKRFQEKIDRYQVELAKDYKARVLRQAISQPEQAMLESRTHPARRILEARAIYGFALYDTVISVPTDHITMEKGFGDRLISRKLNKMNSWLGMLSNDAPSMMWVSTNFPYIAYNTFHPTKPQIEKRLELPLKKMLDTVGYPGMLSPIRRIRDLLHTIKTPVDASQLARANIATEKIYCAFQAERSADHTARRYWNMLKDSATAATRSIN